MWQRAHLKQAAKDQLRGKYWTAFAAALLASFLGGGTSSGLPLQGNAGTFTQRLQSGDLGRDLEAFSHHQIWEELRQGFSSPLVSRLLFLILFFVAVGGLLALAYQVFVGPVIQVGGNRWFSRSRESAATPSIGQVFHHFRPGLYLKTVGGMLWMKLFLFLWGLIASVPAVIGLLGLVISFVRTGLVPPGGVAPQVPPWHWLEANPLALPFFMLFFLGGSLGVLPLIIKQYSYRLTPWILADQPAIGYRRALALSRDLTRGAKWDLFVLDLSFLGWILLGLLACGIGVFFLTPYIQATQAEAYAFLRRRGVDRGLCTMEELGFVPVPPPSGF